MLLPPSPSPWVLTRDLSDSTLHGEESGDWVSYGPPLDLLRGQVFGVKLFGVVGLGRFGMSVAKTLSDLGHEVLAIDDDPHRVQDAASFVTHAVEGDSTDEAALDSIGIRNADVVVVAIGENLQASILTSVILKDMGIPKLVCKAQNDLHGRVLERIGADRVVFPERDMGVRVAHSLVSSNILDSLELSAEYSIAEVFAKPEFVGKSLKELNLRARFNYGLNVIAIRSGDSLNMTPGADDVIHENDLLVVVGSNESIRKLESQ